MNTRTAHCHNQPPAYTLDSQLSESALLAGIMRTIQAEGNFCAVLCCLAWVHMCGAARAPDRDTVTGTDLAAVGRAVVQQLVPSNAAA